MPGDNQRLLSSTAFAFVVALCWSGSESAQNGGNRQNASNTPSVAQPNGQLSSQQQELNAAIELMRSQGMSDEQIEQFRRTVAPVIEQGAALEKENERNALAATRQREQKRERTEAIETARLKDAVYAQPGVLNIGVQGEVFSLSIRKCSVAAERSGNLTKLGWVEAEGTFRNTQVLATLGKSHPAGSPAQTFEQLELWATARHADESLLNNDEVVRRRATAHSAWHTSEQQQIMERFEIKDDMSVAELNAAMEARQEALDALNEDAATREVQHALAHGPVEIDGNTLSFLSPRLSWSGSGSPPDVFARLETKVYAVAQCGVADGA